MPHTNTAVARITAMIIQVEEFVKEASTPKRFRWSSRLISNCSIGLCIWLTSSPLHDAYTSIQRHTPLQGRRRFPSSPPLPVTAASFEYARMARQALLTPATKPKTRPVTKEYGVQPNQRSSQ